MDHQRRADLMLLLATSFWGISNCLTAICLRDMQPLTLNAFRFITAFLVLGFVFRKNLRRMSRVTVKYSIMVGLSLVIVYTSLTYGVLYTSVSNAGFIGALSVVTTPILEFIVYRKKPEKKFGVSMLLCLAGLALMTLNETLKPAFGDVICLFAAAVYRVSDDIAVIETVDFFTPIVDDPYLFGQIAAANALSDVYAIPPAAVVICVRRSFSSMCGTSSLMQRAAKAARSALNEFTNLSSAERYFVRCEDLSGSLVISDGRPTDLLSSLSDMMRSLRPR